MHGNLKLLVMKKILFLYLYEHKIVFKNCKVKRYIEFKVHGLKCINE